MSRTLLGRATALAVSALSLAAIGVSGQPRVVSLFDLHERALAIDPRAEQAELLRRATGLRIENTHASRRPSFLLRGDASYQSEVTQIPLTLGGGQSIPEPPKDRYEASLETNWALWDGGLATATRETERARLTSDLAAVDAELHSVRVEVTDAFFAALILQEQVAETGLFLEDLRTRLDEVRAVIEQGLRPPGDSAVIRAELLQAEQSRDALRHELDVALDFLQRLTGTEIASEDRLLVPDLTDQVGRHSFDPAADGRSQIPSSLRVHPQFAVFDAQRGATDRQIDLLAVGGRPRVSIFGQLSLGSPGYRQFTSDPHEYWRAGIGVQWTPWTWGTRGREVEEIRIRQQVIDTRESSFSERMLRALQRPLRAIAYMRSALESDEAIIALREDIEQDALSRFAERAISAASYADARTDVQQARIARTRHRVELARAQAHYLITLGAELR